MPANVDEDDYDDDECLVNHYQPKKASYDCNLISNMQGEM